MLEHNSSTVVTHSSRKLELKYEKAMNPVAFLHDVLNKINKDTENVQKMTLKLKKEMEEFRNRTMP